MLKAIATEREENGPFTDFYNFLERCSAIGLVNKRYLGEDYQNNQNELKLQQPWFR